MRHGSPWVSTCWKQLSRPLQRQLLLSPWRLPGTLTCDSMPSLRYNSRVRCARASLCMAACCSHSSRSSATAQHSRRRRCRACSLRTRRQLKFPPWSSASALRRWSLWPSPRCTSTRAVEALALAARCGHGASAPPLWCLCSACMVAEMDWPMLRLSSSAMRIAQSARRQHGGWRRTRHTALRRRAERVCTTGHASLHSWRLGREQRLGLGAQKEQLAYGEGPPRWPYEVRVCVLCRPGHPP